MRSRFGCVTCKQRKLKCDEIKPICGPCARGSRNCEYASDAEFRHFEVPKASPGPPRSSPASSYIQTRQPSEEHIWVDVPSQLTFIHVEDPFQDEVTDVSILPPSVDASPPSSPHDGSHTGNIANAPGPVVDSGSGIGRPNDHPGTPRSTSVEPDVIRAYLLWHFKQGPSQWMDLFDTNPYFSGKVSILAATHPMLLSAACALSAKQLSRDLDNPRDSRARRTPLNRPPQTMLSWDEIDWHYQTIRFYDETIQMLKEALNPDSINSRVANGEEFPEDILGAVAIMSTFELMDAPSVEWRVHLSALPLLNEASRTVHHEHSLDHSRAHGRRAIFWSFARQDIISAFIHGTQTFLNLDDRALWHRFGLDTGDFGISMLNEELSHFSPPEDWTNGSLPEESVSNAMTWILGRIVNFVTSGDSVNPHHYSSPARHQALFSVSQEILLQRWSVLNTDLKRWHQSRPASFNPCARTPVSPVEVPSTQTEPAFERIWYHIPMCAAAMQTYHMGRILLLMNRPQESTAVRSTVALRLKSYHETQVHVLNHSREICGISLSMPPESVRIHSLQPLFVAGQCFGSRAERQTVLNLLEGVERDLGWASTYYRNKLREEWRQADYVSDLAE